MTQLSAQLLGLPLVQVDLGGRIGRKLSPRRRSADERGQSSQRPTRSAPKGHSGLRGGDDGEGRRAGIPTPVYGLQDVHHLS
jgi:hypothetical protein